MRLRNFICIFLMPLFLGPFFCFAETETFSSKDI